MPEAIFIHKRIPVSIGFPEEIDQFIGVIVPAQTALPVDDPDPLDSSLLYRNATVELTLTNPTEAEEIWTDIVDAVTRLREAYNYSDGLATTTYWIGTAE